MSTIRDLGSAGLRLLSSVAGDAVSGIVTAAILQPQQGDKKDEKEKGENKQQALVSNAAKSTTDEALTAQAFFLASLPPHTVLLPKLTMIQVVLNELPLQERKKAIHVIGHSTTEVFNYGPDGKKVSSEQKNVMGASLVASLAQYDTKAEIKAAMKARGMLDTTGAEIADAVRQGTQLVRDLEIGKKLKKADDALLDAFGPTSAVKTRTQSLVDRAKAFHARSKQ